MSVAFLSHRPPRVSTLHIRKKYAQIVNYIGKVLVLMLRDYETESYMELQQLNTGCLHTTYHIIVHSEKEGIAGGIAEQPIAVALVVIKRLILKIISVGELEGDTLKFITTKLCRNVSSTLGDTIALRGVHIINGLE